MQLIKIIKTLYLLAWMLFIFRLSSIPGDALAVSTNDAPSFAAHFLLYFTLAVLSASVFLSWRKNKSFDWQAALIVVLFCVLYGASDEFHQSFVAGRDASLVDLSFDALGATLGICAYYIYSTVKKPKFLLHICCAGCGVYVGKQLKEDYNVTLYYYNPNIYPQAEYNIRLAEAEKIAKKFSLRLIAGGYDHNGWLEKIKGREADPERGERCAVCFWDRLEKTAQIARAKKFGYFATTLTMSPHKDAETIIKIGNELSKQYDVKFLEKDFKKQNGFKKSARLSKELNLYRQNYCGCEFSSRNT